jgi:acyl homoserine lactone synthase
MNTLHGTNGSFPPEVRSAIAQYRHAVFIERLGWNLPVANGVEYDQFDTPETLYVVARDPDGQITGCARLLPTTHPYLLGEVFPQLMNDQPIPCSHDIWELSRFASTEIGGVSSASRSDAALQTRTLLAASVQAARERGAARIITVSPLGVERLLARMGVNAHRAGPPVMVDGKPVFACWIEIDNKTISALGLDASTGTEKACQ